MAPQATDSSEACAPPEAVADVGGGSGGTPLASLAAETGVPLIVDEEVPGPEGAVTPREAEEAAPEAAQPGCCWLPSDAATAPEPPPPPLDPGAATLLALDERRLQKKIK